MSLTENLDELSRLTHEERCLMFRRAFVGDEADDVAVLEHTAAEGFLYSTGWKRRMPRVA